MHRPAASIWFEIWGSWTRVKNSIFQAISQKFQFSRQNCPFTAASGQIILFLFKSHHFRTYLLYIIRYNNISRPPWLPATPNVPSAQNLGVSTPPTPRIDTQGAEIIMWSFFVFNILATQNYAIRKERNYRALVAYNHGRSQGFCAYLTKMKNILSLWLLFYNTTLTMNGYNFIEFYMLLSIQTTPCLRKNCAKLFLAELRQISIKFNNFW